MNDSPFDEVGPLHDVIDADAYAELLDENVALTRENESLRGLLCAPPTEQETEPAARLICGLCNTDPRVQIPEDAWTAYTINARDVLVAAFAVRAEQVQP